MEIFDNINKTVKDDLTVAIEKGSKLSVAAARFSIYAYRALKKQLDDIDELRFIFTSPAFVAEKAANEKREFYIPRLNRERSLYGTKFMEQIDRIEWQSKIAPSTTNLAAGEHVKEIEVAGDRLAPDDTPDTHNIKETTERDERRQKLQKEIDALTKKVQSEKQFNRQVALSDELKRLKATLEGIR
ncbi:MAG: DUF4391 domain-containing protein [Coriobacteriales bacterium]|jgi:hypothetical protein|nr:DUF4391 domain-containing protein [Coriobacteriales bacterium]